MSKPWGAEYLVAGADGAEGPLRSIKAHASSGNQRQYILRCSPEKIGQAETAPSLRACVLARVADTRKVVDFAAQDLRDDAIAERDCRRQSRNLNPIMMPAHGGGQRRPRV